MCVCMCISSKDNTCSQMMVCNYGWITSDKEAKRDPRRGNGQVIPLK